MMREIPRTVAELRTALHGCPERSGHEVMTLDLIEAFLSAHTTLELDRRDGFLIASRRAAGPAIGIRADVDAIPVEGDPLRARHGCGHDGHAAILCGLAIDLEAHPELNVRLIFQGAEETGEGARHICETWPELKTLSRIYGLHNLPGHPLGRIMVRRDCFACASAGFVVHVVGRPAHAAYPGDGANPAALLCRLVLALGDMCKDIARGDRLLMHTVIGLDVGGENFGLSASAGRLCLTLRGHRQDDIDALMDAIRFFVREGCERDGMACDFEIRDPFPDTQNDPAVVDEAVNCWRAEGLDVAELPEPMRWSEDFGHYLKAVPGMFFGIGAGETCPALHTADYAFPDALIDAARRAFLEVCERPVRG